MGKKTIINFELTCNFGGTYTLHLIDLKSNGNGDLLPSVYDIAIGESNRFIDFYFIETESYQYHIEPKRMITKSSKEYIKKFQSEHAEELRIEKIIQVGPFILKLKNIE
jgi:hypothetical protein